MRSSPSSSTSSSSSASCATADVISPCVADLGDVAHAAEDAVRDARGAARATGDLLRGLVGDLRRRGCGPTGRRSAPARPARSRPSRKVIPNRSRSGVVRRPGARRRADERERRQVEGQRARRRPLADDDVEPEVLERRVEDLLDGRVQPVDLVHEQDVARLERSEDRRQVALPLERRSGNRADPDAELLADDVREARLAEAGRPDEQHVVERLRAGDRRREHDLELLLEPLLSDEVAEMSRPERAVELVLVLAQRRGEELRLGRSRFGAVHPGASAHREPPSSLRLMPPS